MCCAGSDSWFKSIADIVRKLKEIKKLRLAKPLDKSVDMGAIINESQLGQISKMVEKSRGEGASIFQPKINCNEKGCFYPPTLITDVEPSMEIVREEC